MPPEDVEPMVIEIVAVLLSDLAVIYLEGETVQIPYSLMPAYMLQTDGVPVNVPCEGCFTIEYVNLSASISCQTQSG